MAIVYKKIRKVEVRAQWSGEWSAFHTSAAPGFPGIQIPLDLVHVATSMSGRVIEVDNDDYEATAESAVRTLFASLAATDGPENDRWVLLPDTAYWTVMDKIRWLAGTQAVAFDVGRQPLTDDGAIAPEAASVLYQDKYDFTVPGAPQVGHADYMLCFELV